MRYLIPLVILAGCWTAPEGTRSLSEGSAGVETAEAFASLIEAPEALPSPKPFPSSADREVMTMDPNGTLAALQNQAREALAFAWPLRHDRDETVRLAARMSIEGAIRIMRASLRPAPIPNVIEPWRWGTEPDHRVSEEKETIRPGK